MHIGIWTKVCGHGYMDMGIWTWVYGQLLCNVLLYIVLNVLRCAAIPCFSVLWLVVVMDSCLVVFLSERESE